MAKLWDKGYGIDPEIERFTVGEDYLLDRDLVQADLLGSAAHATMLAKVGILAAKERDRLLGGLRDILKEFQAGQFQILPIQEDVHTAVEERLTETLGDLGKKLHTGRSRNDQVLLDLRLYGKERLHLLAERLIALVRALAVFARKHEFVPMPGRTHMQIAMPSSLGLWAGAWAESLLDDLELLRAAHTVTDQSPLGSGAAYGSALPLDRKLVADLLGFARVQNNVLYCANSRGKAELATVAACGQVMIDLSRMTMELMIGASPEFGYFRIPKELCTGSSMMPQKRNPCGLELVRAKAAAVLGCEMQIAGILRALPSGYNRDFQETKGPFMRAVEAAAGSLSVMRLSIEQLEVVEENLRKGFIPEIYATDRALELVQEGQPFRDAYRYVGAHLEELSARDPVANLKSKKLQGGPGNLGLAALAKRADGAEKWLAGVREPFQKALAKLLG
ncbi:MAG: argininosuccinate lyase [Planctomycetota bacterium]|nr:argininosuccinate lyase [Planctomycetota bacterium]